MPSWGKGGGGREVGRRRKGVLVKRENGRMDGRVEDGRKEG
jgi:hypothetical protein